MKPFEKTLLILFVVAFFLQTLDIAGGGISLAIFGVMLQLIYLLGAWYFFAVAATPNTPKYNSIVFSIIVGMCLSSCVYAITASSLGWTPYTIITPTMVVSFVVIFPFATYKMFSKNTTNKGYYRNILLRSTCLGILAMIVGALN